MDRYRENPVIERPYLQVIEADLRPESESRYGYCHKTAVQQNEKWDQHTCCCSYFMKSHGSGSLEDWNAVITDRNAESHKFQQHNSVLYGTRTFENENQGCRRIEALEFDNGNMNSDNNQRTGNSVCSSLPWIEFQNRGHLYYTNRFILPVAILLQFTGFGTLVLIYTFTLERALPKKLIMAASISLILMLVLWSLLRILEYCLWRKRMGRWHDTPVAPVNDWKERNNRARGLLTRVPFQ